MVFPSSEGCPQGGVVIITKRVVCMARVLVVGAGVAGCAVAYTLAEHDVAVTLLEKASIIGGKARSYGCKATDKCQNCGVCLTTGLWEKVENHENIDVVTENRGITTPPYGHPSEEGNCDSETVIPLLEKYPKNGAVIPLLGGCSKGGAVIPLLGGVPEGRGGIPDAIVVCTGFDNQLSTGGFSSHLHITETAGIITGSMLETLLKERTKTKLFNIPETPKKTPSEISNDIPNESQSVAFVQCVGSRDKNESGNYCSRVCCSYSTRAAKLIRYYYPDCDITFFYMEQQRVESGNYYKTLKELSVDFINSRPLKVSGGKKPVIEYDDPEHGIKSKKFDLVVLSDGICSGNNNDSLAEIYGLGIDKNGFLHDVGKESKVFTAGCAKAPMKIQEAYADAVKVAGKVLEQVKKP